MVRVRVWVKVRTMVGLGFRLGFELDVITEIEV